MRRAVIDLGTNTFNLLIAEVHEHHFDIVFNTKEGVALAAPTEIPVRRDPVSV